MTTECPLSPSSTFPSSPSCSSMAPCVSFDTHAACLCLFTHAPTPTTGGHRHRLVHVRAQLQPARHYHSPACAHCRRYDADSHTLVRLLLTVRLLKAALRSPPPPRYRGFKGSITPKTEGAGGTTSFVTSGVAHVNASGETLTITELPIGKWTQDYKTILVVRAVCCQESSRVTITHFIASTGDGDWRKGRQGGRPNCKGWQGGKGKRCRRQGRRCCRQGCRSCCQGCGSKEDSRTQEEEQ